MSYEILGFRLKNQNNKKIPLLVPKWDGVDYAFQGWKKISEHLQECPEFPFECTWFVGRNSTKQMLKDNGFMNVYSVEELDGDTWYIDENRYITFDFDTYSAPQIVTHAGENFIVLDFPTPTITLGSETIQSYGNLASTFYTNVVGGNSEYPLFYTTWRFQGVNIDGNIYYYGSVGNLPNPVSGVASVLNAFWDGVTPTLESDPYDNGGTSTGHDTGGGGGTGNFDNTSDTIGIPSLPSESGLNTGFFTAFVCTPQQMQQISNYLWNNAIQDILDPQTGFGDELDALKKIVGNPYDAIMGCSLIPVSPSIGGTKEMKMFGVIKTGISLSYASSRWVSVDCGTLNINEYWGGYLDYSPYSKTTSLYLPFIGVVSIDIDLIMGKALQVVYHVDILSGICIAFILVDGSVEFQYQGHCSTTIPITNADYSGAIQSGLGLVGNIANVVTSGVGGAMTGGVAGAVTGAVSSAVSQAPSIASNVMGMKPDIKSGGGVGSSGGILSVKKPYLIIERPRQSLPERQNTFTGYPCNVTMSVGDCSGYTEYETINLDGLFLTDSEKAELESILKGGVYL